MRLKPLNSGFSGGLLSGGPRNQLGMLARHLACFCAMPLLELPVLGPDLLMEGSLGDVNFVVLGEDSLLRTRVQLHLVVLVRSQVSLGPRPQRCPGSPGEPPVLWRGRGLRGP